MRRILREYGAGETPQALKRRGGSPARPRKAKHLERKSTGLWAGRKIKIAEKDTFLDNLRGPWPLFYIRNIATIVVTTRPIATGSKFRRANSKGSTLQIAAAGINAHGTNVPPPTQMAAI
ncbi:hypothetical protein QFZ31_002948 [Neobacillus niacini]|nr:hypothetical protein [Neobacillus niacini]